MLPDRVSNPESLALESDALPTASRGDFFFQLVCLLSLVFAQAN